MIWRQDRRRERPWRRNRGVDYLSHTFLGNPLPDPWLSGTVRSDPVLQVLSDAIHAVALPMAGATSLMHEAKVDIVTVPNLSEHLGSAKRNDSPHGITLRPAASAA